MDLRWIRPQGPLYDAERRLRNEVLLRPIGQPDGAWEHKDEQAAHLVAVDGDGVVGCVLLLPHPGGEGQLMQMAVDPKLQGTGLGRRLVTALLERARTDGLRSVFCHSRDAVVGFYARQGFEPVGEPFEEVGVVHQRMRRPV